MLLVSTALSFTSNKVNSGTSIHILANIISNNKFFPEIQTKQNLKNINRYLNYYESIKISPTIKYTKYYLSSIVINGAPAISHPSDLNQQNTYISIDSNSFYRPVIRIISSGKLIYSSYKNGQDTEIVQYSSLNSIKFKIDQHLFGDTIVEVLHHQDNKFKQLFLVQFNTLFTDTQNSNRFDKENIDGITKDIRYPNEFYLDFFYDDSKNEEISVYEDHIASWKSTMSKFILSTISNKKDDDKISETSDDKFKLDKNIENNEKIGQNDPIKDKSEIKEQKGLLDNMKQAFEKIVGKDKDKDRDRDKKDDKIEEKKEVQVEEKKEIKNHKSDGIQKNSGLAYTLTEEDEDLDDYLKKLEDRV